MNETVKNTNISITPTMKATGLIVVSMLLYSTLPLFIAWWGVGSPFLFIAAWRTGTVLIFLALMFTFYRSLFLDPEIWRLAWHCCLSWAMFFWIFNKGSYALFALSARYVDVSITTVLFEIWPVFLIALTGWLFRKEIRYHSIGGTVYFAFFLALAGVGVVVMSQSGAWSSIVGFSSKSFSWDSVWGIIIAFGAAGVASTGAFGFRWAVDYARKLPETPTHSEGSREIFALMMGFAITALVASPILAMIGFALDESFDVPMLTRSILIMPILIVIADMSWRVGNLTTERLGVNVISYFTPLLALMLLLAFAQVGDVNLVSLVAGALMIIAGNVLVFMHERRSDESSYVNLDDDIEGVELALRKMIAEILSDDPSVVPSHISKNMTDIRQRSIRMDPALNTDKAPSLTELLEFADLRELEEIICHKSLWQNFENIFASKGAVSMRFNQLAGLRNAIRHSRTVTEIVRRDGETSIVWFGNALERYRTRKDATSQGE